MSIGDHPPVAVLGAGAWGTALAAAASRTSPTLLWGRDPARTRAIQAQRTNDRYLPGITLPARLGYAPDLDQALSHVTWTPTQQDRHPGLIILATPVAGLRAICQQITDYLNACDGMIAGMVWTCKGLDAETAELPQEMVEYALQSARRPITFGALSGPSFAREVAQNLPVALTIASASQALCETVTHALHTGNVRIYRSTDVMGVCVGGALKNIMAIACGISDGLKLGNNARAALITRGLAEMTRFGVALGARASTFPGLTGLGDLVLTATGDLSRNRQVGVAIGQGMSAQDVLAAGMTAEGARCTRAVLTRAQALGVSMPITQAINRVLFESMSPEQCVAQLMARDARQESE
ncbi:NAD(P)H-dependent glycerol-3-phosphate dehydrogenase [Orrella marina]|uniref:Glycerol-3-phosphate dehydrogenase [NAD(P)+] n=1 Tax=Orrella marina TaxID=2163011 RepID=A0A2R4XMG8_9BURK|nr:NAD(P)H-dependent glycerol-3-phosphate dehydrogenase [Orrella marina]AWB34988.1 glycerol-3-phosphate dehydrogenase [Orrella marina]